MPSALPDLRDAVHLQIYRHFTATGRAPSVEETAAALGQGSGEVERAYRELAERRAITLAADAVSIRMAHPFSAVPTSFSVTSEGVSYWANCAWDALGIAAILGRDTQAAAECPDCGDPIDLSVRRGEILDNAVIHFVVPPDRFWDDIGYS